MSAPIDKDRLDAAAAAYAFGVMPGDESSATFEEKREMARVVLEASGYPAEVARLQDENERLRAFAFGDAPEWEKANATLKHRVRELEALLSEQSVT